MAMLEPESKDVFPYQATNAVFSGGRFNALKGGIVPKLICVPGCTLSKYSLAEIYFFFMNFKDVNPEGRVADLPVLAAGLGFEPK